VALTAAFENSATISTAEYSLPNNSTTLTPITDDGVYQALVDFNAITAVADEFEVKVYEKVNAGGTQHVIYGPVSITKPEVLVIPSLALLHGWDVTVKRTAGTDRSIVWSIRKAI
jgi:hypothetical protein